MRILGAIFLTQGTVALARDLMGGGPPSAAPSGSGSASNVQNSQTATAATAAAAQAAQAAVMARRAQDSLVRSTAAFQSMEQAQIAAHQAAVADSSNVLGTASNPIDGLQVDGLNPVGGVPSTKTSSVQLVDLGAAGKGQLVLSNGGSVTLPKGTSGTDQVSISGAGSVTTTSGTVTANAGILVTTSGGTLAATNGGSISLTAGSGTLSSTSATTITSTLAGTVTLASGGTMALAANQAQSIPAGSSISFSGSGTGTVTVNGAGTLALTGAGTLALSNAVAGSGGTITAGTGTTSFTSGVVSTLAAGSTVNLTGSGAINFTGSGNDVLPVILQPTAAQSTPAFSTTGTLLSTTGYNLPTSSDGWSGISALSQSLDSTNGKTTVTITQNQRLATLDWLTFNVGKNTVLDFDQSEGGVNVGNWIAINRILDPTLAPSQILGAIEAPGQVYVINQNGIIFTGSAEVNTHALVASTLPMNSNLISDGLLNNPAGQFLFTSTAIDSVQGSTPYDPNSDPNVLPNVASGDITVEKGADIESPGSPIGVGGKIALIAPNIDNEGKLAAPDGQVILAAGQQVGFVAHPSVDPSLRGLDVAVGAGDGVAKNGTDGYIYAPEANVTMTGLTVDQLGTINSGTSVSLNGRIDLSALNNLVPVFSSSENAYIFTSVAGITNAGTVDLGPNSLTEILPDYSSTDTQVGTSLALPSQIYIEGGNFHMEQNAQLTAPNATATLSLGILNTPIAPANGETTTPLPENTGPTVTTVFLPSPGQVTLDAGANLDVSGSSGVQASVAENIVSAQLTAAVLENSALQQTSVLHGKTVQVDISLTGTNADGSTWYGSPIGDLSGYANLVERTVGELTVAGGSVAVNTNGSVLMNPTSTINVSGGSIDYQGAMVQTTKVIAAEGQVLDISKATPNQLYQGIDTGFTVSSSKWGVSQTFTNSLAGAYYDAGYVSGGSGGSLIINTSSATLDGSLYGNTTAGIRQQTVRPTFGTFALDIQASEAGNNPPAVNVVIQPTGDSQASAPETVYLSPDLFGTDGFANATINTGSGAITVAADASISTAPGGSLSLTAANDYIDGQIYVPSGSISVTALPQTPVDFSQKNATPYDPTIGNVEVSSGALIATTGLTFDETSGTTPGTLPYSVNGGSIAISGASTTLAAGSVVDASGGVARNISGKILSGKGGSIGITGSYNGAEGNADGQLVLNGSVSAYGFGQGGSLALTAPAIQVGEGTPSFQGAAMPLVLQSGFFSQGGFSSFSNTGEAGVQILTALAPILTEEAATGNGSQLGIQFVSSSQLPQYPAAPVNLSFSAPGSKNAFISTLSLASGASITTGPTGTVSLTGQLIDIAGDITVPGGTITISGASTNNLNGSPGSFTPPEVSVYLESTALLSTTGETISAPISLGSQVYQTGQVLAGGTISIKGNIVADAGSSLQADGATGELDVPTYTISVGSQGGAFARSATPYVHQTVASNGGSITLNGIEELYFGGSVSAKAGNQTAEGGVLTVASGLAATYTPPPNAGYAELFISESGTVSPGTVTLGGALSGVSQTGGGYFSVSQFDAGHFGSLVLNGNVEFQDSVTINASQSVKIVPDSLNGTIFANPSTNPTIDISAPYISIGASTLNFGGQLDSNFAPTYVSITTGRGVLPASPVPGLAAPTYGAATISLNATDLIDVGFLSLQNIGTTSFSVSNGDIRGGGLLYAAGSINLQAGEIYTPTAATFTIAAFDDPIHEGTVRITSVPGLSRPLPLSAGGTINIYATDIDQGGVLTAPFGIINLGALPDSVTGLTPVLAGVNFTFDSGSETFQANPDYSQHAPVTKQLILEPYSVTSVTGVSDTGQALDLPYGTILNGGQWIAPNGADITSGGLPEKAVNLKGVNVEDMPGSLINLTGGGDLFAYQFSPGVGGTNDILDIEKYANGAIVKNSSGVAVASTSFAVLPGYDANYAPIDLSIDSNGNFPYANSSVTSEVGEQVYLMGGNGLPAGTYTILPARYALLSGAFLVTPEGGAAPTQASTNPDGSVATSGYLYNSLDANQQIVPNVTGFEIDSSVVVNARAEYDVSSANNFLAASAVANSQPVPRLPVDAGQLVFNATTSLDIQGSLSGQAGAGGLGSTVDVGSPDDIYIVSKNGDAPVLNIPSGTDPADYVYLMLSADDLDKFGADSLLIGGIRTPTSDGATIDATTSAVYVQNDSSTPLSGNEIILVSKQLLKVSENTAIEQSGKASSKAENLTIGDPAIAGSGDGALVLVTGDPNAQVIRFGVDTSDTSASLIVGPGASISGIGVTLDSSSGAVIDPSAVLDQGVAGQALVLRSGSISLQIDPTASLASATGLVISNATLLTLESSVQRLSLSSYSSINLYGAGILGALDANGQPVVKSLNLEGAGIFGYDNAGGVVTINAQNVSIDNSGNNSLPTLAPAQPAGAQRNSLVINADTINLGANTFTVDGFTNVGLTAANGMLVSGAGEFSSQGALNLTSPLISGATGANYVFTAGAGSLAVSAPVTPGTAAVTGGLGVTISLNGPSVSITSVISAPSGAINVTADTGNVELQAGGELDAEGQAVVFGNATAYTSGGKVNLTSTSGDVSLDAGSLVDVSAQTGGGNAGTVSISAHGTLTAADGTLKDFAGAGGSGGFFNASIGEAATLSALTTPLTNGGFSSVAFDVLTGSVTVDGAVGSALGQAGLTTFSLIAEQGGITVDNTINASGVTGGTIDLYANQGVVLTDHATLSVAGQQLSNAGQGGLVDIETRGAGAAGSNAIDIATGATIDLSVSGGAGGVLHLRALQTAGGADLQVDPIKGTIVGAASVVIEGYQIYNAALTSTPGQINAALYGGSTNDAPGTVYGDAEIFTNNTDAILTRLLGLAGPPSTSQAALFQVTPGAEIINPDSSVNNGDLTLSGNWDLSSFRFGPNQVAGDLTLRAVGNLVFTGSLTDGFAYNAGDVENVATSPYTWDVISGPSWSYRLVSGAQFSGGASTANYGSVQSLADLGLDTNSLTNASLQAGSLLLGQNIPAVNLGTKTATAASKYAQLIRTGTGSITIDAGGSVDLLNQLASIYTAGSLAPAIPGFSSPTGTSDSTIQKNVYGQNIAPAPEYTAQYTQGGGSISINAQQDIVHLTQDSSGDLVPDTSWQFPTNWLYRRGATSSTDVFDTTKLNANEIATTTWWVNFSNFFEGIGALGGGDVTLNAGGNIVNVDAVVPTNARMPSADSTGQPVADVAANLVELGGGNLSVIAGGAIEGGTYYVEKGIGTIQANNITTGDDAARISAFDVNAGFTTPLPLTLFVGDSSFTVESTNELTIGSTVNPFWLPQGIGNNFNNESIFNTYAPDSAVNLSSLLGTIDIQGGESSVSSLPGSLFDAYLSSASPRVGTNINNFTTEQTSNRLPWTLSLDPNGTGTGLTDNVTDYSTFYSLSAPIFTAQAFSGNIQYLGDQLLAPSSQGTLQLLASGSVEGAFNESTLGNGLIASITVLDDDPSLLPTIVNPFGLGRSTVNSPNNPSIGSSITQVFALVGESPSFANQSLPTLQSYHTSGLLHGDSATPPVQIDTINGNIEDFTLISPESVRISSGLDLEDVSFYIQNNNASDISAVTANRDITLYDPNSVGLINLGASNSSNVAFGDIQISGPGTLEVLAGRNLSLGEGTPPNNAIGTGLGITSIGQSRNPYLPFGGADIIAAAGIGDTSGLDSNPQLLSFSTFNSAFLADPAGVESARYLPDLGSLLGLTGATDTQIWNTYSGTPDATLDAQELQVQAQLTPEARDALATTIFYDVLRDAGRDHNDPNSPNVGTYASGYAAIAALFPSGSINGGDISLTSREIKTTNDGNISLLAPGGSVDVGLNNLGTQAIDQGILTVDGGNISIFTNNNVDIGTSRIFTLHGGNIIIWSTVGNINAGASSKTVQSAPPTRVIVDGQSANVQTDLTGLATGGGIGVLETVVGAPPGNVDLIAPVGTVNAGDAGIRSSGNINVAAAQVLNAGNFQAAGSSSGVPSATVPNISAAVASSSAAGSSQNAAGQVGAGQQPNQTQQENLPSIISVQVIGYGGDDSDSASTAPASPEGTKRSLGAG